MENPFIILWIITLFAAVVAFFNWRSRRSDRQPLIARSRDAAGGKTGRSTRAARLMMPTVQVRSLIDAGGKKQL